MTALIVIGGGLLLLLLSFCSWSGGLEGGGGHRDAAIAYLVGLAVLLVVGIFIIARLGRGIARNSIGAPGPVPGAASAPGAVLEPQPQPLAIHLSPASRSAIANLSYAIAAEIGLSLVSMFLNLVRFRHLGPAYSFNSATLTYVPFVVGQLPYAALLFAVRMKPNRTTFSFALAVPGVSMLQLIYSLGLTAALYGQGMLPFLWLPLFIGVYGLVIWLAWQAILRLGLKIEASSVLVAALAAFVYSSFATVFATLLVRFAL